MRVIEKYTRAVTSSNLKDDDQHHSTEVLAAAALCQSRLGTKLFRVKYASDATTYASLLDDWIEIVTFKSLLRGWPADVKPRKIARLSLDYWLNDVCPVCTGTGYQTVPNVPKVLSDVQCKACNGTAKRPLHVKHNLTVFVQDMVEALEVMTIEAGDETMRKLARKMEL